MSKLLSIVVANFNYGRYLESAIKSVVGQDGFEECELIICDAASTDNSVEIIRRYAGELPPNTHLSAIKQSNGPKTSNYLSWWCSEKDKGQSDAFNKGFSHATGKYLTWLNADDILVPGCLKRVLAEMKRHPKCEWFTGNMFRFTEEGAVIEAPWGAHWLPKWIQGRGMPTAVYGPTTFFSKRIFEEAGRMKVYQNFMMDTDLWMRFIKMGVKQRRINCFCWAFRMHVDSKTAEFGDHKLPPDQRAKFEAERVRSMKETGYCRSKLNFWVIRLWRLLDGSMIRGMIIRKRFKHYAV